MTVMCFVAVLLLMGLGCFSCGRAPKASETEGNKPLLADQKSPPKDECYLPLTAYCEGKKCNDYSRSAADIQKFAAEDYCMFAVTARCGRFRLTAFGNGFVSATKYFDEAGKLVAAHNTTDVSESDSPCPNWRTFWGGH